MAREVVPFEDSLVWLKDAYRAGAEAAGTILADGQLEEAAEHFAMNYVDKHQHAVIPLDMLT